jgi:hypothetical protein
MACAWVLLEMLCGVLRGEACVLRGDLRVDVGVPRADADALLRTEVFTPACSGEVCLCGELGAPFRPACVLLGVC